MKKKKKCLFIISGIQFELSECKKFIFNCIVTVGIFFFLFFFIDSNGPVWSVDKSRRKKIKIKHNFDLI